MAKGPSAGEAKLEKGRDCMLRVTDRYFKVRILEVGSDTIRVSFPGKDYPVDGVGAALEFHDEEGFTYYTTEVVKGPTHKGEGVVLRKQTDPKRSLHRDCFRAPTDLTVRVKERDHARQYDAALINLSAGGALVQTDAHFDFSTEVDLTLSLPGEPMHTVSGHVVHVADAEERRGTAGRYFGIRFTGVPTDIESSITRYMWSVLREMYPPE